MVIDVLDKGLAGTGCHPEGEFFDIYFCERNIHNIAGCSGIVTCLDKIIELAQEFHRSVEFPIQEDFGIEQCEVLKEEVPPDQGGKDRFIGWNTGVEEVRFYFMNGKEVFPFLKLCSILRDFEVEFFWDAVEREAVVGGEDKLLF